MNKCDRMLREREREIKESMWNEGRMRVERISSRISHCNQIHIVTILPTLTVPIP